MLRSLCCLHISAASYASLFVCFSGKRGGAEENLHAMDEPAFREGLFLFRLRESLFYLQLSRNVSVYVRAPPLCWSGGVGPWSSCMNIIMRNCWTWPIHAVSAVTRHLQPICFLWSDLWKCEYANMQSEIICMLQDAGIGGKRRWSNLYHTGENHHIKNWYFVYSPIKCEILQ